MTLHRTTPARAVPLGIAGAGVAALGGLYFVNPNTTHIPLCPLHSLTGLNCPFCGATRATYALLHGEFATALHDNALYVLGLPFLFWLLWRWSLDRSSATPGRTRLVPRALFWPLLALVVVFGVVRNLPFGAFLSPPV